MRIKYLLLAMIFLSLGTVKAHAVEVLFSVEAPAVQTSSASNRVVEDFEGFDVGAISTTTGITGDIGTFIGGSASTISNATKWGGAGGTGKYAFAGSPSSTLILNLTNAQRYVGFWWSAGGTGDVIKVYGSINGTGTEALLATFDSSTLVTKIGDNAKYKDNPNPNFTGQDPTSLFAYVNLQLDDETYYITKVTFTGYVEIDNVTVSADYNAIDFTVDNTVSDTTGPVITGPNGSDGCKLSAPFGQFGMIC